MKGYFNRSAEHSLNSRGIETTNKTPQEKRIMITNRTPYTAEVERISPKQWVLRIYQKGYLVDIKTFDNYQKLTNDLWEHSQTFFVDDRGDELKEWSDTNENDSPTDFSKRVTIIDEVADKMEPIENKLNKVLKYTLPEDEYDSVVNEIYYWVDEHGLEKGLWMGLRHVAISKDNIKEDYHKDYDDLSARGQKVSRKNQIKMGVKVEAEHIQTLKRVIKDAKSGNLKPYTYYQGRIAKDHLKEIKNYYTRLNKMEKLADI